MPKTFNFSQFFFTIAQKKSMKIDIIAIGAHPDDVELSCAGTLMSHIAQGKKAGVIDLTRGEMGTRGSAEIRYEEAAAAAKIMGLSARENLEMADGYYQNTRENQIKIIRQLRKYQPDIVLANAIYDRHPDHGKGARLVYDALFMSGLAKIETLDETGQKQERWRPRLLLHYIQDRWIRPDIVVDITDFFDQKMESVKAYGTQFFDPNSTEPSTYIASQDFLKGLEARSRETGRPCGFQYAEGFTANNKFLGIKDLSELY